MNPHAAISTTREGWFCKTLLKSCETIAKTEAISIASLGNGVTVAFRILGYLVEKPQAVSQTTPLLIRLFPGHSARFARPTPGETFAHRDRFAVSS